MDFFTRLFDPSGFPARWQCGPGWQDDPWLGWLHIIADLGIWSAYGAIPFVLMYFLKRRKDLPFRAIFLLFGAFIFACGTTHLIDVILFWHPIYRFAGLIKIITALVSWGTVFALMRVMPGALKMRSPDDFEKEIQARITAEELLRQTNIALEQKIEERTQELLVADQFKNEFLAMLAHELRNPLAPLRNGLRILRLANGKDPAEIEKTRQMMERQLGHMVHLIDDLLDISRISRGKLELRKVIFSIEEKIINAVESCRPMIEIAGHKITVNIEDDSMFIHGDPTRVAQILTNLLTNASKYSRKGGHIWLTASRDDGYAVISIRDAGIGISPEMLPKIFEMFTQADKSVERSNGGLGIGLSLAKRLCELHGGTIEAHSAGLGSGSEFTVRLPLVETAEKTMTDNDETEILPTAYRILVVDDNQDAADSLATVLRIAGNEVIVAYDGIEAVESAKINKPEIVLLDIGLPKMSGYEVCRAIRKQANGSGKNIIIIALTGWGLDDDRAKSKAAGFDGHLVKPQENNALLKMISDLKKKKGNV